MSADAQFDEQLKNLEEIKKKQDAEFKEYLANPENKNNAHSLASQIKDLMGKNWFTVDSFIFKSKLGREAGILKLQMCKAFGFAEMKIGSLVDGKKAIKKPMFKIIFSKEDRIQAIDEMIRYHQDIIEQLVIQKNNL